MQTASLTQLQVFLTVARLKSFSGAARELGVSTSAVSQAIKQLESELRVALLIRTTRSVSPTAAGQRLVDGAGPGLGQALDAMAAVSAEPGEVAGRLRITVGQLALPFVITPVLSTFRERHPRIELEIVVEERLVDIVSEGYDAGVRLTDIIDLDMVQVRLTEPFRFLVMGAPDYLARMGTPRRPEDLMRHECLTFRLHTTGALYAWELEKNRRNWRLPVRGSLVTNESQLMVSMAEQGLGLLYMAENFVAEQLQSGRLVPVLEAYASHSPGYFLYYPSRTQTSPALRRFIEVLKDVLMPRPAA